MKKLVEITAFCLVGLVFLSCTKSDNKSELGKINFSYVSSLSKSGIPDSSVAYAVIVSIADFSGKLITDKTELPLYNLNGSYISKDLVLPEGNYQLTEFFVIDVNRKVIYATPKAGSEQAKWVSAPLPVSCTISSATNAYIKPEVVAVENLTPSQLGYASFGFIVVNPPKPDSLYCINIQVINKNQPVKAHVQVFGDMLLVFDGIVPNSVSTLSLPAAGSYTLIAESEGDARYKNIYTLQELMSYTCEKSNVLTLPLEGNIIVPDIYLTQKFNMQAGDSVKLADAPVFIRLKTITDSRCPKNAQCFWAGEISVTLDIVLNGTTYSDIVLKKQIVLDNYIFELVDVIPYRDILLPSETPSTAILRVDGIVSIN